jgi:hypothetical protein
MPNNPPKLTRRRLLKAAAATTGAAAGSGALTGFPTIWAQNIKYIVLRHAGPPVTATSLSRNRPPRIWASRSRCRPPNRPICNWLAESEGIEDFNEFAHQYRISIGIAHTPATGGEYIHVLINTKWPNR